MPAYAPDTPALDGRPHLRVGLAPAGRRPPDLAVGNEPGLDMPAAPRADTAAAAALAFLRSAGSAERLATLEAMTSATFSAGHLFAMWALANPDDALSLATKLEEAALAVEFHTARTDDAAKIACFFRGYAEESGITDDAEIYQDLLPQAGKLLEQPRDFDLLWIGHYTDILQANSVLNSGAVQIDEYDDLDLTVMQTPLRLDDITRMNAAGHYRLLTVRSENTFTLEYRRESWVRYRSRRPLPRIDLRPLAARLNMFERAEGQWRAAAMTVPVARLFFDAGTGRSSPSLLSAETVIAETLDHLRAGARRPEWQWSPYAGR